jgi:hypothetical protein
MKSAFDRDLFLFKMNDQRKNRSHRPLKRLELRLKNETYVRFARLRLQFAQLVFAQAQRAEIATDEVKKRRRHHLLQKPKKFCLVHRFLNANEAA